MRRVNNRLGRAVVLVEDHDAGVGKVMLEGKDVGDVRGAPAVDGLVRVAHDTDVAVPGSKLLPEEILGYVGVLEFVDVYVFVAIGVLLDDVIALLEEVDRLHEDVIEVQRAVLLQDVLVARVDARSDLLEVVGDDRCKLAGALKLALGARYRGEYRPRRHPLGVEPQVAERAFDRRDLVGVVVDREPAGHADVLAVNAQNTRAYRVEGAQGYVVSRLVPHQAKHAIAHLPGGLVRERDGNDTPRTDALLPDEVSDAVRDDAGLAATRARQDKQGAVGVFDCITLAGIEALEDGRGGGGHATSNDTGVRAGGGRWKVADRQAPGGRSGQAAHCGSRSSARAASGSPAFWRSSIVGHSGNPITLQ